MLLITLNYTLIFLLCEHFTKKFYIINILLPGIHPHATYHGLCPWISLLHLHLPDLLLVDSADFVTHSRPQYAVSADFSVVPGQSM